MSPRFRSLRLSYLSLAGIRVEKRMVTGNIRVSAVPIHVRVVSIWRIIHDFVRVYVVNKDL